MEHNKTFSVSLSKDSFTFCAAHFLVYRGHRCESLHGHNYRVGLTVEGPLTADHYVMDFGDLKRLVRTLCDQLDHCVLLPDGNPEVHIRESDGHTYAVYGERHYSFPSGDVRILPIQNTTAECLASYIAEQIATVLWSGNGLDVGDIEVAVDESAGQTGVCRMRRTA